ncbi:MAG: hypothetical protein MJZ32_07085 [Bacteroidaceae bacterium]|nr:hypothetical protein [Bacteroidaceae bacterium]
MDGSQLKNIIENKKPHYSAKYRALMDAISVKGDTSGEGCASTFGAYYQTYMYAFIIGLRLNKKKPLEPKEEKLDFAPISSWKPVNVKDFILMTMMNRVEEFSTPWNWLGLEEDSEESLQQFAVIFMREIEAYANAGFEYLQDKWDNQRTMFSHPFVFVQILEELQ